MSEIEERRYPLTTARNAYDLLTEIEDLAREEPARIAMRFVCYSGRTLAKKIKESTVITRASTCNTVGCIAGWTIARTRHLPRDYSNAGDNQ